MNTNNIVKLCRDGEKLRESADFQGALKALDTAIIEAQKNGEYDILIDILKDRSLTWLHLYNYSSDLLYATLAKKDAESMVEIVKNKRLENKFAISYFTLAKSLALFEDYGEAATNYERALDKYQGKLAERGDYRYHLGEALYQAGNKSKGKELLLEGLEEIRQGRSEIDEFLANVWESRCLMILTKLLREDEPDESRSYANQAQKILSTDDRLIILRKQFEEIKNQFGIIILIVLTLPNLSSHTTHFFMNLLTE